MFLLTNHKLTFSTSIFYFFSRTSLTPVFVSGTITYSFKHTQARRSLETNNLSIQTNNKFFNSSFPGQKEKENHEIKTNWLGRRSWVFYLMTWRVEIWDWIRVS